MAKEKYKYCFPNIMAKAMGKVSMQVQLESSMMSMAMIQIGMLLMAVYLIFFGESGWVYKGLILINLGAAFIFISSFLATTYQQYVEHMKIMGIDPSKHKEEIRKRGNIFKRIRFAWRNKKKKKNEQMPIVKEAVENMIKIKQEELKDMKELEKKAEELKQENINKDERR